MPSKEIITDYFIVLQNSICTALEKADGKAKFIEDKWERSGGGGGKTRVIQDGNIIEKGGVNFSAVHGTIPKFLISEIQKKNADQFYATGISIVIHPTSPMIPIIHMNVRYFEISENEYWFGGGIDLTPIYVVEDDAKYFHTVLKKACDKFDANYYVDFKKWADDYFFIKHRNETRGVGGIFFDKLKSNEKHSKQNIFEFVKEIGESFASVYTEIINRNKERPFSEKEKQWQMLRRGRYVEFNLVYDKGTKFGLETEGRTESILMSLPKHAGWLYNFLSEKGSKEEITLSFLKKGIKWC